MTSERSADLPDSLALVHDLVIIGGSAGGLSVAISSIRSGLQHIHIVESGEEVAFPELVGANHLSVGFGESVVSIEKLDDHLVVNTDWLSYRTRGVVVADRHLDPNWSPDIPVESSDRVHVDAFDIETGLDVLVVGVTDHAVELTSWFAEAGSQVVLAAKGLDPTRLSPAGDNMLRRLERERRATVLYRSKPDGVGIVDGFPMAFFDDRRTPDLQFDHVVFASPRSAYNASDVGATDEAMATGKVWFLGDPGPDTPANTAPGWRLGRDVAAACFPDHVMPPEASSLKVRGRHAGVIGELRDEFYNAVITHFEPTHSDLWVLRVKPDQGSTSYEPGQYASLGLGYWEARIDDAPDPEAEKSWEKLIRRSYSISSRMFDEFGYLNDEGTRGELEFYIVLVHPTPDNTPALTPRLALKRPGDRIYLGSKTAGRYTLGAVKDPQAEVVFFGTGTGEAPHNGMVIELLRKGHTGPIISAVSVRQWADLGYREQHQILQARFPNYHYLPVPTREPELAKRYMQDVVRDEDILKQFGVKMSPESTHVFLCGNPSMIGLPEEEDGQIRFPEPAGVVELLVNQGFKLDRRNDPGNIHYEEYW